jgi:DNA polymerase II large subunit
LEYQRDYQTHLREQVQRIAEVAEKARKKGLDPSLEVEIKPADDVAGRVEGLVGPPGIGLRIRQLASQETAHKVAFQIAREIVQKAQSEDLEPERIADQAIRTALAILTEGITAGPIEGIAHAKIKSNADGSRYLAVYFAGPIRAAGGTEAAQTVIVADAVRQVLDLDRFKPSSEIIERYVEEVALYNRISHLQYPSKPEEVRLAARNIPVEITGEPTAEAEVTGYRDLTGVETNRLRGGAILVLNDSLLGKAQKLAKQVGELDLQGWEWLEQLSPREMQPEISVERKIQPNSKFLEDIIAGRPVLAYPSRRGGFRVRYGRSRNTGLAALGVHPATMVVLDNFVACGTQLITERPGKGCIAMPVDSIHGPIVKLKDGSILRIDSVKDAKAVKNTIDQILFLGDLLIGFGEFRENNHLLVPAGYCPEWWIQEVHKALKQSTSSQREALKAVIPLEVFEKMLLDPIQTYPDPWQALGISRILNVPLNPRYLYFWEDLTLEQLTIFQDWLRTLTVKKDEQRIRQLLGPLKPGIEEILEVLCISCKRKRNDVQFNEAAPILYELFLTEDDQTLADIQVENADPLLILQSYSGIILRPKGTFYIGARVGRPEKAKRREMSPPPHGLFPIGTAGGATRNLIKALSKSLVFVDANIRQCPECETVTLHRTCERCNSLTADVLWCSECNRVCGLPTCEKCGNPPAPFGTIRVDLQESLNRIRNQLGGKLPNRIKGVQGLVSKNKVPELLEKAVLRARHDLFVYKDGTIRFDITDAPLTHVKPIEIQASVDTLRTLGYTTDINGTPLSNEHQILELKTQDIIIPEEGAKYLFRVSRFLDDLLTLVYKQDPYYNLTSPLDLIGHLVVGLAPHTSAGIIGRIIGFTPLHVCYAHPYWHAAKRRNCLHHNEEVLIWDTNDETLLKRPIGQIVEKLLENGTPHRIVDDFGTLEIDNPYPHWRTISLDPTTHQPLYQPIQHWIKGHSNQWLTITTHSGRTITITPDHNAMIWNPTTNTLQRIKAHQLKIGDHIPLLSSLQIPTKNPPQTINILQELATHLPNTTKFHTFKHQTRLRNAAPWMQHKLHQFALSIYNQQHESQQTSLNKWKQTTILRTHFTPLIPTQRKTQLFSHAWYKSIPLSHLEILEREGVFRWDDIPHTAQLGMARDDHTIAPYIPFNQHLIRLLGYYITEGYIRDEPTCYQTSFSVPHPTIRTHIKNLIQTLLGSKPYYKRDNHQLVHTGRIHAYLFAYAWKLGRNALSKRIPNFVFNLSREFRLHFLSALIDGDGFIIPRSCRTTIYTANEKLAKDYSFFLSTLGVFARIHQAKSGRFGHAVLERYEELGIAPKETKGLFHVDIPGRENIPFLEDLSLLHPEKNEKRKKILAKGFPKIQRLLRIGEHVIVDQIKKIRPIQKNEASYCLKVQTPVYQDFMFNNIVTTDLINISQCDGDEDSILLALDPMVNFSREFLPTSRGGTMDAPLVLSVTIAPKEIDAEAHNVDGNRRYALEFYEQTQQFVDPGDVEKLFDLVAHRIGGVAEYFGLGFSMPTSNVNYGPQQTMYSQLKTMKEKVAAQLALAQRIAVVDVQDMARRLLDSHFLPDIFGNIRAFTTQKLRCTSCNEKFRRPPLGGVCSKCSGKLVLTVTKAGIEKYIYLAAQIAKEYHLPLYYQQRLENAERVIASLFREDKVDDQQTTLRSFSSTQKRNR